MQRLSRDCYIVRIYRRDGTDLRKVTGIVETVSAGEKRAFKTFDELVAIINSKEGKTDQRKARNKGTGDKTS